MTRRGEARLEAGRCARRCRTAPAPSRNSRKPASMADEHDADMRRSGRPRLRRLCPLAVLRGQVPLLRLQQPCPPPAGRPGALRRAPSRREMAAMRARTGPRDGHQHLPRRRHAVADGAGDGRRDPRRHRRDTGRVPDGIEITLEANPSRVEAERFRGYRAAGVNRVSLGVQALNDGDLRFLGRLHDVAEALAAIELAREIFPRLSFDLIYARPGQTLGGLGGRAATGDRPRRRPSVALPADDRGGHALLRAAQGRQAHHARRRPRRRPLRADAGGDRARAACRPTRSPTTPGPAPRAGTTSSTGAMATMSASARAPMAASSTTAAASSPSPSACRRPGWTWSRRDGHGVDRRRNADALGGGRRVAADGPAADRGHRPRRATRRWPGTAARPRRLSVLQDEGLVAPVGNSRLRATPAGMIVLDAVVADLCESMTVDSTTGRR